MPVRELSLRSTLAEHTEHAMPITGIVFFIVSFLIFLNIYKTDCRQATSLQILCQRVQREFTLNLPSAAKYYTNTLPTSAKREKTKKGGHRFTSYPPQNPLKFRGEKYKIFQFLFYRIVFTASSIPFSWIRSRSFFTSSVNPGTVLFRSSCQM